MNNETQAKLGYALNSPLEESQQVETVEDTASTGSFNAVLDGNKLAITGTFSNLTSPLQGVHVHLGDSGTNGDIIESLTVTDNKDGSGSFIGRFQINESEVAAAFNDGLYVNVHTEDNPTGELRGQIELDVEGKVTLNPNDVQEPEIGGIDLRDLADDQFVEVQFKITRDADFDNVVDFYRVDGDGNVVDPVSGNSFAPGEDGYQQAAIANRVGFDLSVADESTVTIIKEMPGGQNYVPMVVVQGTFDQLTDSDPNNDPQVYFPYKEANADGLEHIRDTTTNTGTSFGFEDLFGTAADGSDLDYNDITFEIDIV